MAKLFNKKNKRGSRKYYKKSRSLLKKRRNYKNPGIYSRTPKQKAFFTLPLRTMSLVFFLIILFCGLIFVFFSPVFVINDVAVIGNHHLSPEDVRETVDNALHENSSLFLPVGHIFFLNKADLTYVVKKELPLVDEIEFQRKLPNILKVKIKERNSAFIWQTRNKYYYVDRNGYAYLGISKQEHKDSKLITLKDQAKLDVELGDKVVTSNFVDFIKVLTIDFEPKVKVPIQEIVLPLTTMEIRVITTEGWQAYFDTARPANAQIKRLTLVLKQIIKPREQLQYIDLRLNDRVFYK